MGLAIVSRQAICLADPCGEQRYLFPVHLILWVQPFEDADLCKGLTINAPTGMALGFVFCPLHPMGGIPAPRLGFIWVAYVELMETFVYISNFSLSVGFWDSQYSWPPSWHMDVPGPRIQSEL